MIGYIAIAIAAALIAAAKSDNKNGSSAKVKRYKSSKYKGKYKNYKK